MPACAAAQGSGRRRGRGQTPRACAPVAVPVPAASIHSLSRHSWHRAWRAYLLGGRHALASTIRPAIFSASLLAAAPEVRASRTGTGLAGSGRMALIDHRDAAEAGLRVLTDPALWGAHHDLTGAALMSWPEALQLLSAELGETVTFQVAAERQFLERLTGAGVPAGTAELLITREWAILAGENDYTSGTFQQIMGRPPRPDAEFLHNHRGEFV